jgi:uncharacterized protein YgbK (DUF1537 family)
VIQVSVRLLADDLTGALDTAAEFVGMTGPLPVFQSMNLPPTLPRSAVLDSGTRERDPAEAAETVGRLAPLLAPADIAYKKIDSLLRGPTVAELAACMRTGLWETCVLCPAFPYQARITRGGRQYAHDATGTWSAVTGDLVAALKAAGARSYSAKPGEPLGPGIAVFDAETEDDLRRVANTGRTAGKVLWSGSGGLAQALTDTVRATGAPPLPRPILGLFGSDHAVTASQLSACHPHWIRLPDSDPTPLLRRLQDTGLVLASFDLPPGLSRDDAAARIRSGFGRLLRDLRPPGTLLVAGGETLAGFCTALGATHLEVQGRIVPGLPRSILRGGVWDGVTVVSKSGAFGTTSLLRDLLLKRTEP